MATHMTTLEEPQRGKSVHMGLAMMLLIMKLITALLYMGYHLYADNFYTSVTLFKDLFAQGVPATGTVLESRRDFRANLKNSKQWAKRKVRGTMQWDRDPPCLVLQWLDNKVVTNHH